MPLFPPGRRQWGERQVLISTNPTKMYRPPRNWQEYTPTERLTSWRFVAMALAREEGMSECRNERDILDEYAMLAFPGTPVERWTDRSWTSTTRTAYFNIIREICLGRLSGEEAKGWLALFEAAGSGIPDGKLQKQLEPIPLRLDKEGRKSLENMTFSWTFQSLTHNGLFLLLLFLLHLLKFLYETEFGRILFHCEGKVL